MGTVIGIGVMLFIAGMAGVIRIIVQRAMQALRGNQLASSVISPLFFLAVILLPANPTIGSL